ncbi:MAG: allophanate hydrolase [Betaproteobacteria bacterium]|nr:allophanate hydrolase [Betaproteobacteria bacterium]
MPNYSLGFAALRDAYARGTLTPAQVVHDVHAEIPRHAANPIWIHVLPREAALAQAQAVETRRAAGANLPLYGVPFAVKDNIDVADVPTTAACPAYAYTPAASAHAVQRLLEAGAILIGKTNLDQFATGLVGARSPYGACRNAVNAEYISGGSSSGSAVAVALGLVSFALGTDTAGSGRVPAGFNNVVGLKPTPGIVSTRGVVPACRSLDCVSVFALTCEDASAVLASVRGFDAGDIYARSDSAPTVPLGRTFRCGVPRSAQREFFGDALAREAFELALEKLKLAGATLIDIDFAPFIEVARLLYNGPWVAERYAAIREFFEAHPTDIHPVTRQVIANAQKWNAADTFDAFYRLRELKRRCDDIWRDIDVLAVPTSGTIYTLAQVEAAPLQTNTNLGYYTNFVNLLDYCALAVPSVFRADGLPAGVTLIARAHQDTAMAELGARLHRAAAMPLGATGFALPAAAPSATPTASDEILLAVVGAHLSGLPLNHQLTSRGARLVEATQTAADYKLYALPYAEPPKPGLVRVAMGGAPIVVEVWALTLAALGAFMAEIPPPLGIGTLTLADGRKVKGFLCEAYAVAGARDITALGGWRAYLAQQNRA